MSRLFAMGVTVPGILLSMLLTLGTCTGSNSISNSRYLHTSHSLLRPNPNSGRKRKATMSRNVLTLIIRSSFPVAVTILSSNGTDLTPSTPILHSHIPLPRLQKRFSNSTSIRHCPMSDDNVSRSWCQHSLSAQSFETFCKEPPTQPDTLSPMHYTQARCAANEICVGSEEGDGTTPLQAHCVSTTDFVPIGPNPSSSHGQQTVSSGVVTAGFDPSSRAVNGQQVAIEAVLTHVDKQTSLFATSHVIQAQWYNATRGIWRTVAQGSNDCIECSSLRLEPFPSTAQRVKVSVVLPESMPAGLLWLASYLYEHD